MFSSLKFLFFYFIFILSTATASDVVFTEEEQGWIKNNPTVKVAMMNDFKPFSFIYDSKHQGLSVDLLDKISKISGLKFDIKTSSWTIALDSFKNSEVDMISGISYTKQRESFTLYTEPFYEITAMIFGNKNDKHYKDNNSLVGKKVAITKNVFYADKIKKLGIVPIVLESTAKKAKAVADGKADYFLDSYLTGQQSIIEQSLVNLKAIDEFAAIKKEDLRFGINKEKQILYNIIQKSYSSIPTSELINLSNKWMINTQENKNISLKFTKEEQDYLNQNPIIKYSEVNWQPLSIIEDGRMKGIMGDFLDLVASRTNLNFKFVPSDSWPDVLNKFKEKKIDLVPGVGSSPQEVELGLISSRYANYHMVIVTGKNYTYIENLNALDGKTIAVPKYYTSYNFIVKNYPNIKLITTDSIPEALLKVENGQANAFVGHIATSLFYLSKLYLKDLKVSGTTTFDFEHHYLIQRDNPILLSIINKAFASITEQEKQKIYSNWVQTTVVEQTVNYTIVFGTLFITFLLVLFFSYRQYILNKYNKSLEDSHAQIEGIINATVESILISEDGKCIDFNKSAEDFFGIKEKKDGLGKNLLDFVADNSKEKVIENIKKSETEPYEIDIIKFDGTISPVLVRGTELILKNKKIRVSSIVDLTEIKEKERMLLEQSKLASMGEMIGNIAHQWRQPLSVISTGATGLKIQKEFDNLNDEEFYHICDSINDNAQYLSKTIDDFRDFIKNDRKKVNFDLQDNINSFLSLVNGSVKNNDINIILINDKKIYIDGYPNELIQCYMNIYNNAKDVLKEMNSKRYIFISTMVKNNNFIISIKDNGGGIPVDILPKIFEPYFTTKHKSQGTGLGLHISYNLIVDGMKGHIEAHNTTYTYEKVEYKGAEFLITLPLSQ